MTTVKFVKLSNCQYVVEVPRHGVVGFVSRRNNEPWKFTYAGDTWTRLSYDENTGVLAAAKEKTLLLNITRRLTS